jgi:hypothetical protein
VGDGGEGTAASEQRVRACPACGGALRPWLVDLGRWEDVCDRCGLAWPHAAAPLSAPAALPGPPAASGRRAGWFGPADPALFAAGALTVGAAAVVARIHGEGFATALVLAAPGEAAAVGVGLSGFGGWIGRGVAWGLVLVNLGLLALLAMVRGH